MLRLLGFVLKARGGFETDLQEKGSCRVEWCSRKVRWMVAAATRGRKGVLSKGSGPGVRAGGGSSQRIKLWVLVADIKGWVGRRARADLGG